MTTETSSLPAMPPAPSARHLGGFFDLLLFIAGAAALFLLVQMAALSLLIYDAQQRNPHTDWPALSQQITERVQYNAFFAVPVQLAYYVLLILLLYALVRFRRGLPFWPALAVRRLDTTHLLPALGAGVVLALLVQLLSILVPPPETVPFDRLFTSRAAAWLIIASSLLAAPFAEELVFRGYIYTLLEGIHGRAAAVLSSGVLFGSIHFPQLYPAYFQMGLLCLVGIVFSLARARTGTVVASMLLHLAYNTTLSALFLASPQFRQLAACIP